jgi:hypothetical protein
MLCSKCRHPLTLSRKIKGTWQCTHWSPSARLSPAPECYCEHTDHSKDVGATGYQIQTTVGIQPYILPDTDDLPRTGRRL